MGGYTTARPPRYLLITRRLFSPAIVIAVHHTICIYRMRDYRCIIAQNDVRTILMWRNSIDIQHYVCVQKSQKIHLEKLSSHSSSSSSTALDITGKISPKKVAMIGSASGSVVVMQTRMCYVIFFIFFKFCWGKNAPSYYENISVNCFSTCFFCCYKFYITFIEHS